LIDQALTKRKDRLVVIIKTIVWVYWSSVFDRIIQSTNGNRLAHWL